MALGSVADMIGPDRRVLVSLGTVKQPWSALETPCCATPQPRCPLSRAYPEVPGSSTSRQVKDLLHHTACVLLLIFHSLECLGSCLCPLLHRANATSDRGLDFTVAMTD
jgi:hypothetical protein